MKRVMTVVAGLSLFLAACGETEPRISVSQDPRMLSGHWVGSVRASPESAEVPLDLNFTATYMNSRTVDVTGSGTLGGKAVTVGGMLDSGPQIFVQTSPRMPSMITWMTVKDASGPLGLLTLGQPISTVNSNPAPPYTFDAYWQPGNDTQGYSGSIQRR